MSERIDHAARLEAMAAFFECRNLPNTVGVLRDAAAELRRLKVDNNNTFMEWLEEISAPIRCEVEKALDEIREEQN